jgi:hypothetical protein
MIALEPADEIIEDEGIGSLGAVFWQYTDEQQIDKWSTMPFEHL